MRIPKRQNDFDCSLEETVKVENTLDDTEELSSAVIQLLSAMLREKFERL